MAHCITIGQQVAYFCSALLDNLEQTGVIPIPDTERIGVVIQSTDKSKVFPMLENSDLCIKS